MRDLDSEPESGTDCLVGGEYRGIRVRYRQDKRNSVSNPQGDKLGRSKSKSPARASLLAQNIRREKGFRRRLNFSNSSNSLKSLQLVLSQESVLAHRRASQPLDTLVDSFETRDAFPDSLSSTSSSSGSYEDDEDRIVPLRHQQRRKTTELTIADLAFENLDARVVDVLARREREQSLKNGVQRRRGRVAAKTNGVAKRDDTSNGGNVKKETKDAIVPSNKSNERREHLYKILVIGELGTGKTSIIKRYVHQFFSQHYRATIGVDFALKVLNWDSDSVVRLQLWDIAGQERFGNMTRVYYKEAVGAFLVFDVTRASTFDAVHKWKADLDAKVQLPDGSPIPCILLANKCDQPKEGVVNSPSKVDEFVKEKGFAGWFETSAKDNINIEEAATTLVKTIMENDKLMNSQDCIVEDNHKFSLRGHENGKSRLNKTCNC